MFFSVFSQFETAQAVGKRIPMELCHRDNEVCELFVTDRLERQSAWNHLRALVAQLEGIGITDAATRMQVPEKLTVRAVREGESRCTDDTGQSCMHLASGEVVDILPLISALMICCWSAT